MIADQNLLVPDWPDLLHEVDTVRARFVLYFTAPCTLRPDDFIRLGRTLRNPARRRPDLADEAAVGQWEALFQPPPSADPVARRRFQKPAPALVMTMPIMAETRLAAGDKLACEVLFVGAGVSLIQVFLDSMIDLGRLGLVPGGGCFDVTEVYNTPAGQSENLAWQQGDPFAELVCAVQPLAWLVSRDRVPDRLTIAYQTPVRLMANGRPLRKPRFRQVFPFMLRRVTSMLFAHAGIEMPDEPAGLIDSAIMVDELEARLEWHDWRQIAGQKGLVVGGFTGEMTVAGQAIADLYWVLAVASLFGIGKGATYGAGHFKLCP